ncbi:uncharacterized protein [Phyllobates terribilis]|uniref:uncharacterized protein isoform X3 n=1 Tax=Phyllobates terribilis TaxID=111132 RepID=UPI003CCB542D
MAVGRVNQFLGTGYKPEKLVTSLRYVKSMLIQVKTLKGKTVKSRKKEIAQFLANGMEERARAKVLSVIREENVIHAMDSLEYHCDVVIQHTALLGKKHLDPNLVESLSTLIYAAARLGTEVTELKMVSELLSCKYGKELCHMWKLNQAGTVNQVIVEKLRTDHPSKEQVDKYLSDIVKHMSAADDTYQTNDQYEIADDDEFDDFYESDSQYEPAPDGVYQSHPQYEETYEPNAQEKPRSMADPPTPNETNTFSARENRRNMVFPPTPNVFKPNVHKQPATQRPPKTETYEPNAQERRRSMAGPPTPNEKARESRRNMVVPPTPNVSKSNVRQQPAPQRPPKTETYEPNAQERRRSMAGPPTSNKTFSGRIYYNDPSTTSPHHKNPANTMPGNVQAEPTNENAPVEPTELWTIPILIGENSIPFNTKELYLIAVVPSLEEIYNMYSDQNPPPIPPRIPNLSSTDDVKSSTYASSGSDYQRWMQHLVKVVPITKPLFEDQVTNKSEGDASNTKAEPILRHAHFFNL